MVDVRKLGLVSAALLLMSLGYGLNSATVLADSPVVFSGRVLDGAGNPVADQIVTLNPAGDHTIGTSTSTDALGRFTFSVQPNTYDLSLQGNNGAPERALPAEYRFTLNKIPIMSDVDLNVSLPLKRVDVHVQNSNGSPVAGAAITMSGADWMSFYLNGLYGTGLSLYRSGSTLATTDDYGDTTMWLFPTSQFEQPYYLTASQSSNSLLGAMVLVTVPTDAAVGATIKVAQLSGRILDGNGKAVASQIVTLNPAGDHTIGTPRPPYEEHGRVRIAGIRGQSVRG